ncbi:unnamed protein product, partial [Symbiodinium sp. CCMP2456]
MSNTSLMSLDRVRALRTRTELLGSVEAVEESFTSATNGMNFLQQIAGSLKTIVNQHVSAAQALKKARQQESETHRKELDRQAKEKKRELEKEAKLQKKLADGKNEPSPAGGCGAGSDAKRRRLFPSAFTEHDPVVLTAQGWSERQVTVVENYAPRLQAAAVSRVLEGENVIIRCRRANVKKAMEDTEKPRHAKLLESDSLATAAMHMCLRDQLRDNYERYYMEDHALRPRTGVVLDFHGLKEKLGSQGSQGAEAEDTEECLQKLTTVHLIGEQVDKVHQHTMPGGMGAILFQALGCKRFSVASVLDLMKLPPVDMKDKLDAFTKLTPEVAAKHDLNVLAGALLPGDALVLQPGQILVTKTHNETNISARLGIGYVHAMEPLEAMNALVQGPEQSGMIDFLIAHAQEAFAEKAAFVPPPQDGDDGSANELEVVFLTARVHQIVAVLLSANWRTYLQGQDQDDEDDGGGRDDDRLTSILDEIEEDVEEEAAKKLQAQ